jgi:hypothetical protein
MAHLLIIELPASNDTDLIEAAWLDAVAYDCGATHIEIMLTTEGPRPMPDRPGLLQDASANEFVSRAQVLRGSAVTSATELAAAC